MYLATTGQQYWCLKFGIEFFVLVVLDFSVIWMQRRDYLNLVIDMTCGINFVIVMEEILSCNW